MAGGEIVNSKPLWGGRGGFRRLGVRPSCLSLREVVVFWPWSVCGRSGTSEAFSFLAIGRSD